MVALTRGNDFLCKCKENDGNINKDSDLLALFDSVFFQPEQKTTFIILSVEES